MVAVFLNEIPPENRAQHQRKSTKIGRLVRNPLSSCKTSFSQHSKNFQFRREIRVEPPDERKRSWRARGEKPSLPISTPCHTKIAWIWI
ncbi:hypothetical protein L596_008434 [Steinernema carpocapsae]|uniref:Uncharacterized protein n=1 Tax=Steinernema carpocapsae TaxID=34508 RepID=A0A4U5PD00_STECR|nr:hypothetical protein L596_008434 [Steinernema carpocapsae]